MEAARRFRFLNKTGDLDQTGWDDPACEKLWRYNLHYFDDLNAVDAPMRDAWHAALMDCWIRDNAPGQGSGWEPYPSSLRIVNWIKRHLSGRALTNFQTQSLAEQVRWLRQRLEWHLLGNHLFANAKALVMAGMLFEGAEADRWLAKGLAIIAAELPEQVLTDGGSFELSPMYHAIFLEDLLDLLNMAGAIPDRVSNKTTAEWCATATKMVAWLRDTCHPDGEISLFNDAAIGIAPPPVALFDYAAGIGLNLPSNRDISTGPTMTELRASGYVRVEDVDMTAILDVAPIGPDYLPGHAHADTLSFELSVFGQRVIVNGGTSRYGLGPERLRERGTAAHSTLTINGEDSSEVWGGFRVARRARPFDLQTSATATGVTVACSHDGYRRLPGRPVHRREWRFVSGKLEVHDQLTGHFDSAQARFHFHPAVHPSQDGSDTLLLELPHGRQLRLHSRCGKLSLEPAFYAPAFGQVQDTWCAVIEAREAQTLIDIEWI